MDFEWDEAKSERTRRERGFGFDDAARIFAGAVLEWCDVREEWTEVRILAIGAVGESILAVIYVDRGDSRRIISARKARKQEAALWLSFVNP